MVNTLKIYERLRSAELNNKAAKEIAEIFKETIDKQPTIRKTAIATKTEIIKWTIGSLIAQAIVIAVIIKLL